MVNQISIFIQNKAGTLEKVLRLFKQSRIQLITTTVADTQDFGICRVICTEPQRACLVLKEAGITATLTQVQAISLDNTPGMAADALEIFAADEIEINYLYSFLLKNRGVLIFKTDNKERADRIISEHRLTALDDKDLLKLAE
ncbi:ACT domain-containing protein [Prevotella dentalis DSM 3688]|uniref:ACT domain-containing protein n=1 Tax=Prevotella dentalis (strain ATCC 49559 / DSM 3688 / JCM 13448 / NCTC 12043 / ES 2772) TaxID=908937 RepID=F9D1H8_PREDD|nr:amino acid-binding protein [Prevotella dentalis]AGB28191.1 ACT domain-containing protein [Prevotella dentalis DSM 3688]EGQ16226.1 acetolactate synthase [Prevotella dentalis DSM 3688]